ncbi:hypothetical protein ACP70R_028198 [Stipagrostis hirtigluma subsp. patula]
MLAASDIAFWVIGGVVVAAFAIAIMCHRSDPPELSPEERLRAAMAALAAVERPAPAVAVALPLFPYVQARAAETLVCSICLEALRRGEACSAVPACGHVFHGECIGAWARSKGTCPLCRVKIAPGPDGAAAAADMV